MPLNAQQTEQLRRQIETRSRALVAEIRADIEKARQEPYGELAGAAPDTGDESVATLIQDLDQFDVSRDLSELRALEDARNRIADGTFGQCVDCGADIDFKRLRANPGAVRCIRCQDLFEKTHAGAGRPTL